MIGIYSIGINTFATGRCQKLLNNMMPPLTNPPLKLAGGLVEPGPYADNLMPLLLKVLVRHHIVVTHHLG